MSRCTFWQCWKAFFSFTYVRKHRVSCCTTHCVFFFISLWLPLKVAEQEKLIRQKKKVACRGFFYLVVWETPSTNVKQAFPSRKLHRINVICLLLTPSDQSEFRIVILVLLRFCVLVKSCHFLMLTSVFLSQSRREYLTSEL